MAKKILGKQSNKRSVRSRILMEGVFAVLTTMLLSSLVFIGCTSHSAPDKTIGGAVLGAGWGAGAGAVVGNQVGSVGPGTAVGSGFGLVSGAMVGAANDQIEDVQAQQEDKLASLKLENMANERQLAIINDKLDNAVAKGSSTFYTVYFEPDETSLRAGSIAALESIADSLKADPGVTKVEVVGHADDSATPAHNDRLAESRARTVSGYLAARGISTDQINVSSFGSQRPISSNTSPEGRRLNRRVEVFVSR